jgi:hypothetical protein
MAKLYRPYTGEGKGSYVSVVPDLDSRVLLSEWATQLGFFLSSEREEELHCTLTSSDNKPVDPTTDPTAVYTARLHHFEFWPGHDNVGYLVAKLTSQDLVKRNEYWRLQGADHAFDDYSPHVTLVQGLSCSNAMYQRMLRLSDRERGTLLRFTGEQIEDRKS